MQNQPFGGSRERFLATRRSRRGAATGFNPGILGSPGSSSETDVPTQNACFLTQVVPPCSCQASHVPPGRLMERTRSPERRRTMRLSLQIPLTVRCRLHEGETIDLQASTYV